jgi:hypothetical protein
MLPSLLVLFASPSLWDVMCSPLAAASNDTMTDKLKRIWKNVMVT